MVKKKIVYPVVILIIAILLLFVIIRNSEKPVAPSGNISAFFHLYSSFSKETLEGILDEFKSLYPDIKLEYTILPYQDMKRKMAFLRDGLLSDPETVIVSTLIAADINNENISVSPGSWTGQEWRLYYNKEVLAEAGMTEEDLVLLASENLDYFLSILSLKVEKGRTYFSVGASFYLPWLAWVQHLELGSSKGKMPNNFSVESWSRGIEQFDSLVRDGYVNSDFLEINNAESILRMFRGESLFALSTQSLYSIFLSVNRSKLSSIPFPGSEKQGWYVGSSFYIASQTTPETDKSAVKAANTLISYLRSNEIRERFLLKTGILLKEEQKLNGLVELPSITQIARENDLNKLLEVIR